MKRFLRFRALGARKRSGRAVPLFGASSALPGKQSGLAKGQVVEVQTGGVAVRFETGAFDDEGCELRVKIAVLALDGDLAGQLVVDLNLAVAVVGVAAVNHDVHAVDMGPGPAFASTPGAQGDLDFEFGVGDNEAAGGEQQIAVEEKRAPGDKSPGRGLGHVVDAISIGILVRPATKAASPPATMLIPMAMLRVSPPKTISCWGGGSSAAPDRVVSVASAIVRSPQVHTGLGTDLQKNRLFRKQSSDNLPGLFCSV